MAAFSTNIGTTSRDQVTTEWDDIQRRLGNLPSLVEQAVAVEAAADAPAALSASAVSVDAEQSAEDDDDDEAAELQRLRCERLDELMGRKPARFGSVVPLLRTEYVKEVNQAPEGVGVVVFLHKPRHYLSSYMLVLLEKLARKFGDVKFLQIDSEECIPGYPERNLPTLLMYRDDDLLRQCTGPSAFGGSSFGIDSVEWELAQAGIVETELKARPSVEAPFGSPVSKP